MTITGATNDELMKNVNSHLSFLVFINVYSYQPLLCPAQTWLKILNEEHISSWVQRGGKATYEIIDDTLIGYSKTNTNNSFLCSKRSYDDFILEFEFLVDDALNSGVQIRSNSSIFFKDGRVFGKQFEIDPSDRSWTGGIYDESRRKWLYPLTENVSAQKAFKSNQWNKARIEAIGPRIRTWVNGIPCADLIDSTDVSGFIAFQVHTIGNDATKEGKTTRWRNIRICTQDVGLYLLPDNPNVRQIVAKAPVYSFRDFINMRFLIRCLLIIICIGVISFFVFIIHNKKAFQNKEKFKI